MYLHNAQQGSIQVICFRILRVEQFDRVIPTWDLENLTVEEITWKFIGLESGWRHNQCKVITLLNNFLQNSEQNIRVDCSFVGLVKHDARILVEIFVNQSFSEEHTVSHVFYDSFARCKILKSDRITDFSTQCYTHFLANTLGYTHCCDSSWLGTTNFAFFRISCLQEILCNLGRFSWTCFTDNN